MTKFIALLCLYLMAACAMAESTASPYKSISKDSVSIRSGPSEKQAVLFTVNEGHPVRIEKTQGKWVKIRDWEGDTGWVLKDKVQNIRTIVITTGRVNVRSGPSMKNPSVSTLDRGMLVQVLQEQNGWLKLANYDTHKPLGWIYKEMAWGH